MRQKDREVSLDGSEQPAGSAEARQIGEKLLLVDELEDTLDQVRRSGDSPEQIHALERRLTVERQSIQAIEQRGNLMYEEIARVMEAVDRSG